MPSSIANLYHNLHAYECTRPEYLTNEGIGEDPNATGQVPKFHGSLITNDFKAISYNSLSPIMQFIYKLFGIIQSHASLAESINKIVVNLDDRAEGLDDSELLLLKDIIDDLRDRYLESRGHSAVEGTKLPESVTDEETLQVGAHYNGASRRIGRMLDARKAHAERKVELRQESTQKKEPTIVPKLDLPEHLPLKNIATDIFAK